MEKTLNEIARLIDGEVDAVDGEVSVKNLSNITAAVEGDLIFAVEGHIEEAARTKASAVLIPSDVKEFPLPSIRVSDPKAAFARLIEMFGKPQLNLKVGVSERACIGAGVKLGRDVVIMPLAVIDDNATIGDGAIIYPHVYIGQHATIGAGTIIYSSATVREYCTIGARCVIHSSAVIGS
ncbi:MAG: UDP-3-O-(3-hydroxymyristoyl)glucosamine N-acyltransferase, partial [Selenomonadaceae bacterium]|nr:UDP-3-O-(3-hydroxymyristoyl)glucosamine N-acyltransferase [Selenomonadaceae bacterium]